MVEDGVKIRWLRLYTQSIVIFNSQLSIYSNKWEKNIRYTSEYSWYNGRDLYLIVIDVEMKQ